MYCQNILQCLSVSLSSLLTAVAHSNNEPYSFFIRYLQQLFDFLFVKISNHACIQTKLSSLQAQICTRNTDIHLMKFLILHAIHDSLRNHRLLFFNNDKSCMLCKGLCQGYHGRVLDDVKFPRLRVACGWCQPRGFHTCFQQR